MQGWSEGFQKSIDFIEQNLCEALDINRIAGKTALSPFYYQRIFGALCGMTVGEYVRARRMTLVAQALSGSNAKVIDVAVKYGYDSPDSFAKAFQRFHGITPSQARVPGAKLRSSLRCTSRSRWRVEVCWIIALWKRRLLPSSASSDASIPRPAIRRSRSIGASGPRI